MAEFDVAKLYIALFARAPEGEGLYYWLDIANENYWDDKTLAQAMYEAALSYPQYSYLKDPKLFVETIYQNVLNKTYSDDPNGIDYWADQLDKAKGNLQEIINAFANSEESQKLYGNKPIEQVLKRDLSIRIQQRTRSGRAKLLYSKK